MVKILKLLLKVLFFSVLVLVLVFAFKTFSFSSKQLAKVDPVAEVVISDVAVDRFVESIQTPTISYHDHIDTSAFVMHDSILRQNFPLFYSRLHLSSINTYSHIYKWKGKDPSLKPILLIGHTDVVPIEDAGAWQQEPFSGAIVDDYIWGRGTLDDKINVIGLMEAATLLLQEEFAPSRDVYFAFGHDEEVGGKMGAKAMANYFEAQGISFEFVLDEGLVVLKDALDGLEPPLAMIGIAEKGFVNIDVGVQLPEGGHSAMPPKETAIGELSKAVAALVEHPFPGKIDGATRGLLEYAGPEMGMLQKTIFANLWATKGLVKRSLAKDATAAALIRTTTSPTIFESGIKDNVLPSIAKAKFNFRILPGETAASVRDYVVKTINNPLVRVTIDSAYFSNPSPVSSTVSFGFRVMQKSVQEIYPEVAIAPGLVIAATDARAYQKVAKDVYRFTPVVIDRSDIKSIHGNNERISIENYKNVIRFYKQLILNSSK